MRGILLALAFAVLASSGIARADDAKGDPQFGFADDTDIGNKGDRGVEFDTTAIWGKRGGSYAAVSQLLVAKYTILDNLRLAPMAAFNHHHIRGVPGLDDRNRTSFAGLAFEMKYRLLERGKAPFGLAVAVTPSWQRVDEATGERVESYGMGFVLAADKELIADRLFAAINVGYDASATQAAGMWTHGSGLAIAGALSTPIGHGVFVGAEIRHERAYDGLGLDRLAGHALFVGPNINAKLSKNISAAAAWLAQVSGHATGDPAALDLTNFERHRFRFKLEAALEP